MAEEKAEVEGGSPRQDNYNKSDAKTPNAAEMVLWLYLQKGPQALSLLRGRCAPQLMNFDASEQLMFLCQQIRAISAEH